MSLLKYKVLQSTVKDGVAYLPGEVMITYKDGLMHIPGKVMPIGVIPDAETGLPAVAFLMLYTDWAEEFPEEALREAQVEALIHNAEVSKDGEEKGGPNAQ
ncbi:hypothetical protein MUP59_03300 [Candidatus Bathyarchaeota archaeon]|nr:hypothetical protein [Candidatus Bathyarchaeota archaeon]